MLAEKLCFIILTFLTTPPGTPTRTPPAEDSGTRKKKCPGCQITHDLHGFGHPGRNCQGPQSPSNSNKSPSVSPNKTSRTGRTNNTDLGENPETRTFSAEQIVQYRQHLQLLKDQEAELLESIRRDKEKQIQEEQALVEEIKRQTEKLERLKASRSQHSTRSAPPPETTGENPALHSAIFNRAPTDTMSTLLRRPLLPPQQQSSSSGSTFSGFAGDVTLPLLNSGSNTQRPSTDFVHRPISNNELFLRPTRTNDITRGKPLRIVDFVSRIRPAEDEKVLSYDNNCKLALILQDSKPKLSSVTIEQFNIANLRIFYELLFSGKLSTLLDVQEYLSYAIKVLELATKYTWQSVLQYDDEFRILQHTYGFSWSTDHSHLHEVVLTPRWAAKLPRGFGHSTDTSSSKNGSSSSGLAGNNRISGPPTVTHLSSGSEICRMFNSRKGCQKSPCKFVHACNRKVGSQACGKSHQGFLHPVGEGDSE